MHHSYVLAQHGEQIELVRVLFEQFPQKGQRFERMPGLTLENWTIIKVFDPDVDPLHSLEDLMGFERLADQNEGP